MKKFKKPTIAFIKILGLDKGSPVKFLFITYVVVGIIAFILNFETYYYIKIGISTILVVSYFVFLGYALSLMFPASRRVRIIVKAYDGDPSIINFFGDKVKEMLEDIKEFIDEHPDTKAIKEAIGEYSDEERIEDLEDDEINAVFITGVKDRLSKIPEEFPKKSINNMIDKGTYLTALIGEISSSYQIDKQSVEGLVGTKIDVCLKIIEEIDSHYSKIKSNIEILIVISNTNSGGRAPDHIANVAYHWKEITKRLDDLDKKEKRLNNQIDWLEKLKERKEDIPGILKILKETSTGTAVVLLSNLFKETKDENWLWLCKFTNARMGFPLSELLGLKLEQDSLKWYGKPLYNSADAARGFFDSFEKLRNDAHEELSRKFIESDCIDLNKTIAIALTFGYSSTLKRVLEEIIAKADDIHIILIKDEESPGEEELLKAKLEVDNPELTCSILPIETVIDRGIYRNIQGIFIGIEGINEFGDIVHPRGGAKTIKRLKEASKKEAENREVMVFAFGETYKVQKFDELDIDYTKLALLHHENIHYVVTDHGVHERIGNRWKIDGQKSDNLSCCMEYWKNLI